jgi:hypothetical protein
MAACAKAKPTAPAVAPVAAPLPSFNGGVAAEPAPAATTAPESPGGGGRFGDIVGLHVKFAEGQPESELSTLEDLGIKWVRDSVSWRRLEPVAGQFVPFPAEFARRLSFYRGHHMGLIFILAFANDVAYPPSSPDGVEPIDPIHFARYAVEVAKQLEAAQVHFVLEIWNEPQNFTIKKLTGGAWNGAPPSPWVQQYVKMVDEVVKEVKAAYPSIELVDDDDMWVLHYRFIEAGLPRALDGFAFHPYTRHTPQGGGLSWFGPERAAVSPDTIWTRPFVVVDDDSSFESAVARLRDAGSRALGSIPGMWITEWGCKLGDESVDGPITEDVMAAYLTRAYVLAENAGARALCWFSSEDRNDGSWGLIANDGRRRKPYYALRTLTRRLADFSFKGHIAGNEHRTAGAQAFLFCRQNATCTLVVWDVDAPSGRLRLSGPLFSVDVADVFGAPLTPTRHPDGTRMVPVGPSPIYLSGLSSESVASPGFSASVQAALE